MSPFCRSFPLILLFLAFASLPLWAQTPPNPVPDTGGPSNVFYGATPPTAPNGPVLVFVHGLRGVAWDWYDNNDMYQLAYAAGYRTAFITINLDGTRNDAPIEPNADVIAGLIPQIAARFGVPKLYLVTHSKGGPDSQAAITTYPAVAELVEAVFMISPPNTGTDLADWAFGEGAPVAEPLGLLTPGVEALKTDRMAAFREKVDAVALTQSIRYYTFAGTTFTGNALTAVTGLILTGLNPLSANDGLVPSNRTRLPIVYASEVGYIPANHFQTFLGNLIFPKINAIIRGASIDEAPNFTRIDPASGFGDRQNSFAWSMIWFKGKLYVGTGRAFLCITNAIADATTGSDLYVPFGPNFVCTPNPDDLPLRAEVWEYTPELRQWRRAYRSPEDVPIAFGPNGFPLKFTARDIAYRGMAVHVEADGTEALYVAGVNAAGAFSNRPPYNSGTPYPAPRILRSTDGVNWAPLPADRGTFMGDIGTPPSGQTIKSYGFRSLESFGGKLYATVTDFTGVGYVIASSNPRAGNNAWERVSPIADEFPVWTLKNYNGALYAATGSNGLGIGYGVYKTNGEGPAPFLWTEVVPPGAKQAPSLESQAGLSFTIHNNELYVGTDRPSEMIKVRPDDTWELIVGALRVTAEDGVILPKSNYGTGMGNLFNGHFWSLASHNGSLFAGTWDWTITLRIVPELGALVADEYGFDLFSTTNDIDWFFEAKNGFNDRFNYGARNMVESPYGLFVGTANPYYGLQVWLDQRILDLNRDGQIDLADIALARRAVGQSVRRGDPRDLDGDLRIGESDMARMATQCSRSGCASSPAPRRIAAPAGVKAARGPAGMQISWNPVPGAVRYHVYHRQSAPVRTVLPPKLPLRLPGIPGAFTVQQIADGYLDTPCRAAGSGDTACRIVHAIRQNLPMSLPVSLAGTTSTPSFTPDSGVSSSLYFVRAEDASGQLSRASGIAPAARR